MRRNDAVDVQQGIYRLERGQYYYNSIKAIAQTMIVPFNWEKHELTAVGHNPELIANDALQFVLPNFLSVDTVEENQSIQMYPNPSYSGAITIKSTTPNEIRAQVYDMLLKQVKKETLTNNLLKVSDLNSGVYIVRVTQNNTLITKKLVIK